MFTCFTFVSSVINFFYFKELVFITWSLPWLAATPLPVWQAQPNPGSAFQLISWIALDPAGRVEHVGAGVPDEVPVGGGLQHRAVHKLAPGLVYYMWKQRQGSPGACIIKLITVEIYSFRDKLECLSLNFWLSRKGLPGTNTLAYYGNRRLRP